MAGLLGEMSVRLGVDTSQFNSGIGGAAGMLQKFVGGASSLGPVVGVIAGIGAAAIGFGAASVSAAADFQSSMAKVQAYAGLSKSQVDSLSQSVLQMAAQVGQSPKALADALYPIMSAGYGASDALNILKLSAETAAASGANTSTVADALTTSLKSMGAPASQATAYMDMINKMTSLGKGTISDYAGSIGKLSLSASSAHVPFSDMGAALADLTTHGFPSVAQASTALGNLFNYMGPKISTMATTAGKLGIAFNAQSFSAMSLGDKINYLNKVTDGNQGEILKLLGGSKNALQAFNSLSASSQTYTSNLNAMKNAHGATANAFAVASNTYNMQMQKLNAAFQVLLVNVGSKLLPVLSALVAGVIPIVTAFTNWLTSAQTANSVSTSMNGIIKDLTNAWIAIQPQVTAAVKAVISFGTGLISRVMPLIQTFGAYWKAIWPGLLIVLQGVWNMIAGVVQVAWALVSGIINIGLDLLSGNWKQAWNDLLTMLNGIWSGIVRFLGGELQVLIGTIDAVGGGIAQSLGAPFINAWNTIQGIFSNITNGINNIIGFAGNIGSSISNSIPGFAGGVRNFGGGWAMVGENGPELVKLGAGSDVYNNMDTSRMLTSSSSSSSSYSGGGGTQVISVELDGQLLAQTIGNKSASMIRVRHGRRVA